MRHKAHGLLWFMTLLVLAVAVPAFAFERPTIEFDPELYLCRLVDEPPAVDGRLDDVAWMAAGWSSTFVDIRGGDHPEPRHATRMKMVWDERYLYVGAWLDEPHVWARLSERDAVIYHDNDFEIFIDPDGDNHLYYELEINALGTEWDLLLVRPYRDGGPAINAWDIQGLRTAVWIDGTLNDPSDTDRGWSVEMAIPWDVLSQCAGRPAPPGEGDIWRMNFSRVQWQTRVEDGEYIKENDPETGRPRPEDNWVWSPQGLIAMHMPEMWGEVMFTSERPVDAITAFRSSPEHRAIAAAQKLMAVYYLQRGFAEEHGRFADLEDLAGLADDLLVLHDQPRQKLTIEAGETFFVARLIADSLSITVDQTGKLHRNLIVRPPEEP